MSNPEAPTIVELTREFTIKLPDELTNQFHPLTALYCFHRGTH